MGEEQPKGLKMTVAPIEPSQSMGGEVSDLA